MLLVLGSINADLLFKVTRLPRPGETVLCPGYEMAPGGKGSNQAAAAAKAGAGSASSAMSATTPTGRSCARCWPHRHRTGPARRQRPADRDRRDRRRRRARTPSSSPAAPISTRRRPRSPTLLGPGMTVLCQNEIRTAESSTLLVRASGRGARTMLNLAPAQRCLPASGVRSTCWWSTSSRPRPWPAWPGTPLEPGAPAGRRARPRLRGHAGRRRLHRGHRRPAWQVPVLPIRPLDTTGAGDTFTGVLAAWLDDGAAAARRAAGACVAAACSPASRWAPNRASRPVRRSRPASRKPVPLRRFWSGPEPRTQARLGATSWRGMPKHW